VKRDGRCPYCVDDGDFHPKELDKTKLPERIRDAQQAIVKHMEEFFRKETTTPDEHQMLYDALTSLRDLQRLCQQCEDRVCERKPNKQYGSA